MKKIVVTAPRPRPLPLLEDCWRRGQIYADWMENRGSLTSPATLEPLLKLTLPGGNNGAKI